MVGECVKGNGYGSLCAVNSERPRDGLHASVALGVINVCLVDGERR